MPDNGPIQQAFFAQQAGMSPQTYQQLMQAQQQQALAQALMQQGTTPVSTEGRSIGGVGYKISPWEGVAKLGQVLAGESGQKNANEGLANALTSGGSGQQASSNDPIVAAMPPQTQSLFNRLMLPESMGGSPRAGMELYNTYASGMKSYGSGVGTAAAGNAPVGAGAPGIPGYQSPTSASPQGANGPQQPMGTQPPVTPVQGPQALPPIQPGVVIGSSQGANTSPATDALSPASNATALAAVRGNASAPPIDNQLAGNGALIPQVPASALQPPSQGAALAPTIRAPMPGETNNQYEAYKKSAEAGAVAQAQVAPAGAKKLAEENADNAAENLQQYNSSRSQTQAVLDKINDMHQANKASSFNAMNTESGTGPATFYHRLEGDPTSQANAKLEQLKEQGLISQIGPQLAGTGSKGNKLLEGIIQGSDSFKLNTGKPAVATSIDGLGENYIRNQVSQYDKAVASGLNPPPMQPVLMRTPKGIGHVDPRQVGDVINKGGTFDIENNPIIAPKAVAP